MNWETVQNYLSLFHVNNMNKEREILYVEDDETLGFLTSDNLQLKGYKVTHCINGKIAFSEFQKNEFDICILDVMLPEMDGFELAKKIRRINKDVPIIFLTAKTLLEDKIEGLKTGGDDYIIKPFSIEELTLKIEIFLKRNKISSAQDYQTYIIGKSLLSCEKLTLTCDNETKILTAKEAELIKYFAQNLNKTIKREDILLNVWGDDDYFLGRSLDVFISRLRKYFNNDTLVKIENIHGFGFIMRVS